MDLKGLFFGDGDTPIEPIPAEGPRDRLDSGSAAATPDYADGFWHELIAEPYGVGWSPRSPIHADFAVNA